VVHQFHKHYNLTPDAFKKCLMRAQRRANQSSHIRDKLNGLGLVEQQDYQLIDVYERGKSGAQIRKHYTLTPKAFKKCLMRAQRRANQPIDPVIYVDYYLLLEDIFKLYGEYQSGYSNKLLSMKDDKIDALMKKMDAQSDEIYELKEMNREVLGYAKDTKATLDEVQEEFGDTQGKLDDVQDDLTETKKDVKRAKNILEEKCKVSTRNPPHERDHHYFAVTVRNMIGDVRQFTYTTGSQHYVDRTVAQLVANGHEITIPMFYNANGFDLRKNCQTAFKKLLKERLNTINKKRAMADSVFNMPLNVEIRDHNRKQPTKKRSYQNEKRTTKQLKPKDVPIRYRVRTCEYHDNPYISFDEVRQIVIDTNAETQKSPMANAE